ncbi:tRNA (adenosine(37)-N6)-threonylcarbamoyltransferase complex transferase subunit TsaD [Porphyromonas sp.]|uniref:tRNA (adenosine(37)-N6)-threonylcarbamoyltransferase complex transferase subunit TsaD n=1 Tax=Porphyromonas sp. TaxID=1924944 RepID=UPI0026DDC513|nr:tRNA (adenosine(37)-N6)-threonylcarbamoyltransferase complex transferase subunit TsaD [Porphyromonas sp.]MDO4695182.1 tRNA (adenosine(37)-N6)-threonylcarbamoyltransferase complex transferase subunit TsaD [Porphyromonas sp.]MDO4770928.1 tRNA (adenosine(37)-N6)-threonylcarbamoyltransferase complex transferase subunit TsaD [Porphyromonas sp.]
MTHINPNTLILGIESSCDDTSAAVLRGDQLLSNVIAGQKVHEAYGGVVPELASRAHLQNIVPVVSEALKQAGVKAEELNAIAFTRGPGLLGSLLVGTTFAKGIALGLDIPLVDVNHLQAHVLAHYIQKPNERVETPKFPFICLLVSGGNSQIILVRSSFDMEIIGKTIDDAAGEAFDKCAKVMGLGYPGGPIVNKLALQGNPEAFHFAKPQIAGFDYSFSGLKTSFLYTLRDELAKDPDFVVNRKEDLCASLQKTIIDILMNKLEKAAKAHGIKEVALAGGVSANSGLRDAFVEYGQRTGNKVFIPPFAYTTDNAAMVAMAGSFAFAEGHRCSIDAAPYSRVQI